MAQQHGLTWGGLDFVDPTPTVDGWLLEAIADGTNFGNPKALIQVVRSLLTDGSLAVLEGWDNREVPIRLRISAPDDVDAGPALAAAEAALMAEVRAVSKSPLIYVPPATGAATSVFDVVAATLERDFGDKADLEEKMREYRYFLLTLTCLPFARPEETVVVPAIPVGGSTVVSIDDCTSTTGWAIVETENMTSVSLGSTSGYVSVSGTTTTSKVGPAAEVGRTGAIALGATPYLRLTISQQNLGKTGPTLKVTGGSGSETLSPIAVGSGAVVSGVSDYYYQPTITSITSFTVRVSGAATPKPLGAYLRIHDVSRTDFLSSPGTTRQRTRTATVGGSAPTQAAIRLFDDTSSALGSEIMVHTSLNDSWQPALRPFRISSAAVTSESGRVSGARNTLASPMVFRIPASRLTEGTYALMAMMNITTGGSLGWSARMVSSAGATTVGSSVTVSGSVTVPVTTGYQVLNLAAIPLPVVKAEADQMVELTLTGTANMTIDEGWLFGLHDGVLTWIRDTDSLTWIEIRSPELGAARPAIFGGTGAKGANSIDVSWKAAGSTYGSFGSHRFDPGLMQIFTVTSTSLVSQSEIEFYPRYHSHVEGSAA